MKRPVGRETAHVRGVVAAGDPQTAEAGGKLLRQGGNAVDAAVAAAFAAFVCELPLCSPLGGAVCVLEAAGEPAVAYDMFARTPGLGRPPLPAAARDFDRVTVSFGAAVQDFHVGRASAAVPLALAGLLELHAQHGSRPLADVIAPAIALGRDGYVLGAGVAYVFWILTPIVHRTPECRALFADAAGAIGSAGSRLVNPDLAAAFEAIARDPGHVARIYALLRQEMGPERGGLVTDDDIAAMAVTQHTPVLTEHAGWRLATRPYPSSGGALVALGLRMLEGAGKIPFLSREHQLFVAAVQEALLAERDDTFADRCADPDAVRALLAEERVRAARDKARDNLLGSTTHISAIDEHGTAVAITLSNGEGSGHVLPGTGMIVNNLLGEEDIHPRGFHHDPPGTRLNTMMAPTLLSRGADRIALGSGGSNRLRTAILQVLVGLVEHGLSPERAVAAPRLHLELLKAAAGGPRTPRIAFEALGLEEDVVTALRQRYPLDPAVFDAPNLYFGGVHLAIRRDGMFEGVGDPRRAGARVVV